MPRPDELAVIDALYSAALASDEWPDALTLMAQAVGGVGTVLLPPFDGGTSMSTIYSPSFAEGAMEYERVWWKHDTRNATVKRKGVTGVITDARLFTDEEMRKDPFYQDFLRGCGLGYFMAQVFTTPANQLLSLSVQASAGRPHFQPDEIARFSMLASHAARAFSITTHLVEAKRFGAELTTVLDHLSCGVLFLDAKGRVTFVSGKARALLRDGLSVVQGRLVASLARDQSFIDRLIQSSLPDAAIPPLGAAMVNRPSGKRPMLVEAVPIRPASGEKLERLALGPGGVMVLLHDLSADAERSVIAPLMQMGLTLAEARVAELVGRGLSPIEAALKLGVSPETTRFQLKRVFEKLEFRRQSELAILVTRIAWRVGNPPE